MNEPIEIIDIEIYEKGDNPDGHFVVIIGGAESYFDSWNALVQFITNAALEAKVINKTGYRLNSN